MDDVFTVARIEARLAQLAAEVDALRAILPQGGPLSRMSSSDLSGTAPIVDSEAGTAGTAATALRSDTKPGNKLCGDPGDATDDAASVYAGLEYVKKTDGTRRGQRVKAYASYTATKQPLGIDSEGVHGKVSNTAGNVLEVDAAGLFYDGTPAAHKTSHQDGGGDEISIAGLAGEAADVQKPKIDGLTAETTVADADTFPFYDATASANRKVTAANLKTYCQSGLSGGATVTNETTFSNVHSGMTLDGTWRSKDISGLVGSSKSGVLIAVVSWDAAITALGFRVASGADSYSPVASGQQVVIPFTGSAFEYAVYDSGGGSFALQGISYIIN